MSSEVVNIEWKKYEFWQKSKPNQSEPNQSELNQSEPNQSKPNQSKPNQSNWNFLKSPRAPWSYFFSRDSSKYWKSAPYWGGQKDGWSGHVTKNTA